MNVVEPSNQQLAHLPPRNDGGKYRLQGKIRLQVLCGVPNKAWTRRFPDADPGGLAAELVQYSAGTLQPRHHHTEEQLNVLLSGVVEVTTYPAGETRSLPAGSIWYFEKDEEYALRAVGPDPALFVEIRPRAAETGRPPGSADSDHYWTTGDMPADA